MKINFGWKFIMKQFSNNIIIFCMFFYPIQLQSQTNLSFSISGKSFKLKLILCLMGNNYLH